MRKRIAHEQELWYEEELRKEIGKDWEAHGKKPLKKKDKNEPPSGGGIVDIEKEEDIPEGVKTQKCSATDPESGWFQKGEHKHVFACVVEKACDKHDWISGYRTPAIVHELPEDGIEPLFPYKRPMTRDGFYRKYEYVYDEYYDCKSCGGVYGEGRGHLPYTGEYPLRHMHEQDFRMSLHRLDRLLQPKFSILVNILILT